MYYEKFSYSAYEWDNLPPVVPRFTIHLEKHLAGLTNVVNELHEREHIDDLRHEVENNVKDVTEKLKETRLNDLAEKKDIKA